MSVDDQFRVYLVILRSCVDEFPDGYVLKLKYHGAWLKEDYSLLLMSSQTVKVKVSPLQAKKAHGGCECKGPHIHSCDTRNW